MLDSIGTLLHELRDRGVTVSPAEGVDAAAALAAVDLESRDETRTALRLVLAKNRRARETFDAVFDELFVAPGRKRWKRRNKAGGGESPNAGGAGGTGTGSAPLTSRVGVPAAASPMPATPAGDPRSRPRTTPRPPTSKLARELRALSRSRSGSGKPKYGRDERLRRVVLARREPAERGPARGSRTEETSPPRLDVAGLTTADERRLAAAAVEALAALRLRLGRRLRPGRRGRFSVKRTLRRSLRSGGVPFVLAHDRRRRRRPHIVLLLDVSRSVALAASLLAYLSGRILAAIGRTRVFAFVDQPVDVTGGFAAWMRSPRSRDPLTFRDVVAADPRLHLDAPSDYGRTLFALTSEPALRVRDLVLMVLGDGRNNRFEPMEWALAELAARARFSAWVVAEPADRWGTGDSVLGLYLPRVDVAVEAGSLAGLVSAVRVCVREIA